MKTVKGRVSKSTLRQEEEVREESAEYVGGAFKTP
jgi:hypothetical protein